MNLKATIYDESDTAIEVSGVYHPGLKSPRDNCGVPIAPDDEPDIEIVDAVDQHGNTVNLTRGQEAEAMDSLWEELANQ